MYQIENCVREVFQIEEVEHINETCFRKLKLLRLPVKPIAGSKLFSVVLCPVVNFGIVHLREETKDVLKVGLTFSTGPNLAQHDEEGSSFRSAIGGNHLP